MTYLGPIPLMRALVLLACTACGRVAFDPGPDGATDGSGIVGPCGRSGGVPSSVVVRGKTFTYTNFNNGTAPLETSAVTAYALDLTSTIATTTSDASGLYSLAFPTAGQPRASVIAYEHLGYWTTSVHTDQPFDRDVMGLDTMHWRLGDGPLWSDSSMVSVYGTLGATLDNTKGTLSVSVRDCADNIVEGVSFAVTQSPQVGAYLDGSGLPSMTATSTVGPYTQYVAFNVEPGPTHIRASAAAMQFVDLDVVVKAGQNMTYTVVHPIE